ncbi:uncharacterized protein LOC111369392 isoform X2 [Olea europaea var. sylvestris]|uniref:uncharacterized protein LOC111369392 isoform X2 n=1 Tax=Olea europaea var. sylvestris TaxID=158386 RepID=UPI000C1CDC03|nr:uncharacterized protein LOC111369392 isoform X2 [Olea europaea var. sylvestris]
MPRGGKTRRLQDMLPQSQIAPDRDELRELERVDESVHQPPEQRGQGNVIGTDPIAVERIAIAVASAMRNSDRDFSIERATKLGAKVFTGTADPAVAQAWMTKIERVFDVMGCSDDRKLCLATFLLEEGAYDWWQSVQSTYLDPSIITWTEFRRIFYDVYYPRSYKDAKQEEFLKLVQGQMTVAEYQVRFIELSKYAQVLVSNEIDKCRRFENGLREEIRSVVTAAGWNVFGKLVESALRVEKSISDRPSGREQTMFRASDSQTMASVSSYRPPRRDSRGFRPGVSSSSQFKSRSRGSQGPRFSPSTVQQPVASRTYTQGSSQRLFTPRQGESFTSTRLPYCQLCTRPHLGTCLKFKESGVCYHCGQGRHIRRNCPVLSQESGMVPKIFPQQSVGSTRQNQTQRDDSVNRTGANSVAQSNFASGSGTKSKGQAGRPKTQGKVFAMTQQAAEESPDVIMGSS